MISASCGVRRGCVRLSRGRWWSRPRSPTSVSQRQRKGSATRRTSTAHRGAGVSTVRWDVGAAGPTSC
eukprot:3828005-Pyramimonas_sp.AAC.1